MRAPDLSRSELGDFLRARRERLSPDAVGFAQRRRRRTPGLRREEVAELAGIGVDWYIRLEQGRSVSPSATTIDALARALQLGKAEHAHLKALARCGDRRAFTREAVPETIRNLVENLPQPAYVTGQRWDVLAWNRAAADLFGFDGHDEAERNILLLVLTQPEARSLFGPNWAAQAQRMVAQFRVNYDFWAGDPAFEALLDRLRRDCPEFSSWWEAHDIRPTPAARKQLQHPEYGAILYDYATFQSNDDPALKLALYTRVGPQQK